LPDIPLRGGAAASVIVRKSPSPASVFAGIDKPAASILSGFLVLARVLLNRWQGCFGPYLREMEGTS
jgi:hypothetical protein